MSKVILFDWMSLDGVVQAPAYRDEDTSGGFTHGGWHTQYFEERSMTWLAENLNGAQGFLLGRRTYEMFAAHWPNASENEQTLAQPLNTLPKYVASRTLQEPLVWQNSRLLGNPIADSVSTLRRQDGGNLLVIGSPELATTLLAHDLVDELRLMIDPVILGGGKRFFREDGACLPLALSMSETTATGAILATYVRLSAAPPVASSAALLPRPPRMRGS